MARISLRRWGMNHCTSCGLELSNGMEICAHHLDDRDERWAESNRSMCDFIHRRRQPVERRPRPADLAEAA